MEHDEETYMVCMRVDELDTPIEDSTTTACVECGTDIWISTESRKEMHQRGAMPLCSRCAERMAQERPTEVRGVGVPSRGQFNEMLQGMRDAAAMGMPSFSRPQAASDEDTFEALKESARTGASRMTSPSDDWGSMVVMENFDGAVYPPLPLGKMLDMGIPKAVIARQLIPGLAHTARAKRVIFGMSTWTLEGEEAKDISGAISDHPSRKEKLVLLDITADGVQQMSYADITRVSDGPPELGEWHDTEKPEASDGLFVDALVPTLGIIKQIHEGTYVASEE